MSLLKNGILWKDVHGEPIHAHGGYIIFHEGYFYWYGEDRRENYYVSCYRSANLKDWEFRRHVLTTQSEMQGYRVRTTMQLVNEDGNKVNLERPKVLLKCYLQSKDRQVCHVGSLRKREELS